MMYWAFGGEMLWDITGVTIAAIILGWWWAMEGQALDGFAHSATILTALVEMAPL
jgi:hypothetical protein